MGDFVLRPSCYQCSAKSGRSEADITIGDFWGIEYVLPLFDDDKGVSLIMDYMGHTDKIKSSEWKISTYGEALAENFSISSIVKLPFNRDFYFHRVECNKSCIQTIKDMYNNHIWMRGYRVLYRYFMK